MSICFSNVIHLYYCRFVGANVIVQNGFLMYGVCCLCCVFVMNKKFQKSTFASLILFYEA